MVGGETLEVAGAKVASAMTVGTAVTAVVQEETVVSGGMEVRQLIE